MEILERVPADRPLVVEPRRKKFVLLYSPVFAFCLACAAWMGTLPLRLSRAPGVYLVVLALATAAMMLALAGLFGWILWLYLRKGPLLAADSERIWLRLGVGRGPCVVALPWSAVTAVEIRRFRGATRQLCVDAPALAAELAAIPRFARWSQRLRPETGTPFVVGCGNWTEPAGPEAYARLIELAAARTVE